MAMRTVYVRFIKKRGVAVWRPVKAVERGEAFKLAPTIPDDERSDDDRWEFAPGSLVRCEARELSDRRVLVAVEDAWPPRLGSPETLLGRLQRGLGSAARELLAAPPAEAHGLLMSCLETDPRWEWIDVREDYYARLGLHVGIDVSAVEVLSGHEAPLDGLPLAGEVLARMAARGNAEAITAVRAYFATGDHWDEMTDVLTPEDGWPSGPSSGWSALMDGLAEILCERYPTVTLMSQALLDARTGRFEHAPWPEWGAAHPLIGSALAAAREPQERERRSYDSRSEAIQELPTAALLRLEEQDLGLAKLLARRVAAEDVRLMLRTAEDPSLATHAAAVNALAIQGHSEVLPAVTRLSELTHPGMTRLLLSRALEALPYAATRSTVTEWLTGSDSTRRGTAAAVMAKHAIDDDVDLIRVEFSRELDCRADGGRWVTWHLAQALGRHPARGPFPELDRVYRETSYSYGRSFIVKAIAATDPHFPDELAIDCLWDCEPVVRAEAARHARRSDPIAVARLEQMRQDPFEEQQTRDAAA